MSNKTGHETVTFNAHGVADLLQGNINNNLNIRNYGNSNDKVFTENINNQLGKIYMISRHQNSDYVTSSYTGKDRKSTFKRICYTQISSRRGSKIGQSDLG